MSRVEFPYGSFLLLKRNEKGSVLVIGMIFLVIIMIGAVSIMSSSVQDEKISGNVKRSSDAFMAAEAGMRHALSELDGYNWYDFTCGELEALDLSSLPACNYGLDEYDNRKTPYFPLCSMSDTVGSFEYTVRPYDGAGDLCEMKKPSLVDYVTLVSTGRQSESERTIIFKVSYKVGDGNGDDVSWPALYVNDTGTCTFNGADSAAFIAAGYEDGEAYGPAVATNSEGCVETANTDSAVNKRRDQYLGGIHNIIYENDFTDPAGQQRIYEAIIANGDPNAGVKKTDPKPPFKDILISGTKDHDTDKIYIGSTAPAYLGASGQSGETQDYRITVVNGDVDLGGNLKGAGLLIVKGDLSYQGTPDWNGVILVLGGDLDIGGGGTGSTGLLGSIIVSSVDTSKDPWEQSYTDNVDIDMGAGGATYAFDCESVMEVRTLIGDTIAGISNDNDDAVNIPSNACGAADGGGGSDDLIAGSSFVYDWYEVVNQ